MDAALEDLASLANDNPRDRNSAYAFMLVVRGRLDDLHGHLERLAALEEPAHNYHFQRGPAVHGRQ